MSTPTEKNCPIWANYLAQDESGEWFAYEQEPQFQESSNGSYWYVNLGRTEVIAVTNSAQSLQKVEPKTLKSEDSVDMRGYFDTLPAKVNYIAQDADGQLWGYITKPIAVKEIGQWSYTWDTPLKARDHFFLKNLPTGPDTLEWELTLCDRNGFV